MVLVGVGLVEMLGILWMGKVLGVGPSGVEVERVRSLGWGLSEVLAMVVLRVGVKVMVVWCSVAGWIRVWVGVGWGVLVGVNLRCGWVTWVYVLRSGMDGVLVGSHNTCVVVKQLVG